MGLGAGLGGGLPRVEHGVVEQDSGVGLEHVVEHMEAVGAAHLLAGAQRGALRVVEVSVAAHEAQQLRLEGAHLRRPALGVRGPV